ncbi:MAG TPA: TrkH family potassium uptake protein [Bacteroidia bacterium]|nr:TrkH family potassium uptake protein [Bacteroidia bacterium]HNT79663.1 TrkH family potassium uptake protein [Bacteroidia bacterium]
MKLNYKVIASFLGSLLGFNALFMLACLVASYYYQDESWDALWKSIGITMACAIVLFAIGRGHQKNISKKEAYLVVTLGWILMTLSGCLPYIFNGDIPSFASAVFETMSGYTTTGASVLTDIEAVDKGILLWRSTTHWIGGMGIIVLTIAILPILGIGGMQLFNAESPGLKADKINPRITGTAKRLWALYFLLTLLETVLLKYSGMGWFDALNHAFSTMSTGGFSTKNASIMHYDYNQAIQWIIIVFMFVAGMNFALTYFAFVGNFKKIIHDHEFRFYATVVLVGALVSTAVVWIQETSPGWNFPFRDSLFQVVAVVTTTGFVSADMTLDPLLSTIFFMLLFAGGMTGSTAGGIKSVRHLLIFRNSWMEFKRLLHPNAVLPIRLNKAAVRGRVTFNIMAFVIIYFLIFAFSSLTMSLLGEDFMTSIGVAASCLGNVGPALGSASPVGNYASISEAGKLFLSFIMLVGRLELFTVLILFTPFYWRKY